MRYVAVISAIAVAYIGASRPVTVLAQGSPTQTIKGGVLDEIKLFSAKLPATKVVVMRPFSATDADLTEGDKKEDTKTMQPIAPGLLADEFVAKVKTMGAFAEASVLTGDAAPADAIVVEGKFREMDPGSRAKRYFVGYGAGKSGVMVEGAVKSSDGTVLATFQQRRVGVMGFAGGDSIEKMKADTKAIGEDLAKFLSAWATGKKLK
jgi:hypothetical protein